MGVALLLFCTTVAGAAPAHDDIAQATVITALPFTDGPLTTTGATTAADDPYCAGNGHTVWYVVTPATHLSMTVNTFGSDYDTTVSVYSGAPGALTLLACNDDFQDLQSQVVFEAYAGTTYYIMVGSYGGTPGGSLLFQAAGVELGPPPANDDIVHATVITALPFTDGPLTTTGATTAPDDPDCAGHGHTVWYTVTPATDLSMAIKTLGSDYNTTVSVYTGAPGALTRLACNDDFQSAQSRVVFSAVAGTTYYIMVGSSYSNPGGSLLFQAMEAEPPPPPPPNDDIADATVITALPFTDGPLTTATATTTADDPDCAGHGHTVWYVVTPTADRFMIVHTFGSKYDTTVSVYTGAPGALTPLACNDNFQSAQSRVVFQARAGTTYYIMVGSSYGGPGGRLLFWAAEPAPLEASVFGLIPQTAVCKNANTGQQVTLSSPAPTWDCQAAGIAVYAGNTVTIQVLGTVEEGATDVGGAVIGMAPLSGNCTNVSTGQQVQFQDMLGAREASCVAAGLVVQPGETVQMHVRGVAE